MAIIKKNSSWRTSEGGFTGRGDDAICWSVSILWAAGSGGYLDGEWWGGATTTMQNAFSSVVVHWYTGLVRGLGGSGGWSRVGYSGGTAPS